MSTPESEHFTSQLSAEDAKPVPRKRAVKKVAAKKAAKETAVKEAAPKPTAAKKTAVKKTAVKKAAKKAAPAAAVEEAPRIQVVIEPKPAKKEPLSEKPAAPTEGKKFGRVPGGGPVVPRENVSPPSPPQDAPTPSAPQEDARQPQPQNREGQQRGQPRDGQPRDNQPRDNQPRDGQPRGQQRDGQQGESRSKRRRDKRKRRGDRQGQGGQQGPPNHQPGNRHEVAGDANVDRSQPLSGPKIEADGMLELAPKGFGFLRIPAKNFDQARDDVFVTPEIIRKYHLRLGQWVHGVYQIGPRGPQLVEVTAINGITPEQASKLPHFDELKAINPSKRISFETTPERFTTRVVDIMAPVGRGQRGLIVSPPRSGKTTLLLHMAEAIREKYDEAIHLMVLLVDERPEEVTEFRRALPGAEIYASSNDEQARNHCRIAELAIERAKRLVEAGKDVFLLMDSITRLARAYNNTMGNRGRGTGSGGITIGALEVPRRLFAAARNTRGGGSLTILATALIQTNSRADEAIFMEFKGTGNMELVLDRKIAENYIYPAVDIFKSGTRREELLLPDHMLHKIHLIRRGLSGHRPVEAMERLLFFLKKFPNNPQMLLEIKG